MRAVLSQQDEDHFEVIIGYRALDQIIQEERKKQQQLEAADQLGKDIMEVVYSMAK